MSERTVRCTKFGEILPGLNKPPFPGELGQRVFQQVSRQAWEQWRDSLQIKILNEYRLNMADPGDHQVLLDQMMVFLNLEKGAVAEVEDQARGKKGAK